MDSGGQSNGSDSRDTVHYPKVVLVTGACRFLGGYLTARLAQNPLINHVIAVDAIAPSKDLLRRMGRAEFVRADIRNPFIAKVIRNGEVDTVVHAAAAQPACGTLNTSQGVGGRHVATDPLATFHGRTSRGLPSTRP